MAYDEDYYKKLKEQDYVALQQSEVQLENARQRAMKNMQTNLDSLGMGSSGFGSTARAGVEGQYMQGLQNAQNTFQENIKYHQQQYDDYKTAETNDYLTMLGRYTGDNDSMYSKLEADGYGSFVTDAEGKKTWVWNEDKLAEMNPRDASMLKTGVEGLDYDNIAYNQGLKSKTISDLVANASELAMGDEDDFANRLLTTFIRNGLIVEDANGKRTVGDLSGLNAQTRSDVEGYINQYDLLNRVKKTETSQSYYDPEGWFAKAYQMTNKNSFDYLNAMTHGYNDVLNGNYTVKGGAKITDNETIKVTVGNNTKYKITMNGQVTGSVKDQLDRAYPSGAEHGFMCYFNGKIYIKGANGWLNVKANDTYFDLIKRIKEYTKQYIGYDQDNPIRS